MRFTAWQCDMKLLENFFYQKITEYYSCFSFFLYFFYYEVLSNEAILNFYLFYLSLFLFFKFIFILSF